MAGKSSKRAHAGTSVLWEGPLVLAQKPPLGLVSGDFGLHFKGKGEMRDSLNHHKDYLSQPASFERFVVLDCISVLLVAASCGFPKKIS